MGFSSVKQQQFVSNRGAIVRLDQFLNDVDPARLRGLKIITIGFLVTVSGFVLYLFGLNIIGRTILYSGFITGFVGVGVHIKVFMNARKN